jgi:phospholipid/cholesterol/gamma-HCH transport system substrate-binding protein
MPRTRSLAWSELKIGIVSIIALILATVLIFLLTGEGGFFWQRYSIKTVFSNIQGLNAGAPVRVSGVEVGSVSETNFSGDQVEVVLQISKANQSRITSGSRATLGSVSLLGEAAVDITASSSGTPVPAWGYITAGAAPPTVAEVGAQASAGIEELTALLKDVRQGRGTVGRIFTDEALYRDITTLVQSADRVVTQIGSGPGTLGRLSTDPQLYNELSTTVADLRAVTTRIRSGEGSLGKLLNDPALANSLTGTTQNVEAVTGRLNRGEGTAGKLLTESELYDRINSMALRLDTLTSNLNAGEGTAGLLLRDKQLYENMNQTVGELRGLIVEIKKDPKKYLNVKVSIF